MWYYSDLNHDHGAYTIDVDGSAPPLILSSYDGSSWRQEELLFGTPVDPGPHYVLTITNLEEAKAAGIHYF